MTRISSDVNQILYVEYTLYTSNTKNWREIARRLKAIKIIQKALHNWLYKPICKDGKPGILPSILRQKYNLKLKNL